MWFDKTNSAVRNRFISFGVRMKNNIKLRFYMKTIIILSFLIFVNILNARTLSNNNDVKVYVKKIKSSPPTYQYKVTNINCENKIFLLGLGYSTNNKGIIKRSKQNIPIKILSPVNWEGKHSIYYQNGTLGIHWSTRFQNAIKPGEAVDGLIIEMPEPEKDNILTGKADMMNLSFKVVDKLAYRRFGLVEKISNNVFSSN